MSERSAKAARRDRELTAALKEMTTSLQTLTGINTAIRDKQEKEEKHDKAMLKHVPVIGKIVSAGFKELKQSFSTMMKMQERALARGLNLGSIGNIGADLNGLTDSLTALDVNFTGYEAGLRTNNKSVGMLVLQSKLLGGNYKKLAQSLAKNTAGMGMNDQAIGHLAHTTQGLSQGFKISVDELTTAMDGLGEDLNKFAALNLGADMQAATATLAAGLGPQMANLAPKIVSAMSSGSNMIQMAMLDGGDHVRAMLDQGQGPADTIKALLHMGDRAKEISKQYTDGAAHSAFALEQFTKVHGKDALILMRAADAFRQNARLQGKSAESYMAALVKEREINKEFANTWTNFKNKIFDPLRSGIMLVAEKLMKVLLVLEPFMGALSSIVGGVIVLGGLRFIWTKMGLALTFLKGLGPAAAAAGKGGAAGAPGVAAFGAALATVSLQVSLIAAAIGVAGAGLGILFHGFEGIGGGSAAAQSSVTAAAGRGGASAWESTRMAAENSRISRENQNLLRQLVDNTDRTATATVGVGTEIRRSAPRDTVELPYKD